jgi:hypothetical protein
VAALAAATAAAVGGGGLPSVGWVVGSPGEPVPLGVLGAPLVLLVDEELMEISGELEVGPGETTVSEGPGGCSAAGEGEVPVVDGVPPTALLELSPAGWPAELADESPDPGAVGVLSAARAMPPVSTSHRQLSPATTAAASARACRCAIRPPHQPMQLRVQAAAPDCRNRHPG